MDEALVEHASAKAIIGQLESMYPNEDLYDSKFTLLGGWRRVFVLDSVTGGTAMLPQPALGCRGNYVVTACRLPY